MNSPFNGRRPVVSGHGDVARLVIRDLTESSPPVSPDEAPPENLSADSLDCLSLAEFRDDPALFELYCRAKQPQLLASLEKRLKHHDHAEDLSQEILLAFWLSLERGKPDIPSGKYLGGIRHNHLCDFLTRDLRHRRHELPTKYAEAIPDSGAPVDAGLEFAEELASVIERANQRLSHRQREIFRLMHQRHSDEEIADLLGISSRTVARERAVIVTRVFAIVYSSSGATGVPATEE